MIDSYNEKNNYFLNLYRFCLLVHIIPTGYNDLLLCKRIIYDAIEYIILNCNMPCTNQSYIYDEHATK